MTTRVEYLQDIEDVIRDKYRCGAVHRQTVFVHEKTAKNVTVWFGDVEVFDLDGCSESKRCYAWKCVQCDFRIVTILHSNIVDSPHRAVQAAVFTGLQPPMLVSADDPKNLRQQIEKAKTVSYETALKTEDLEAIMQSSRQSSESVSQSDNRQGRPDGHDAEATQSS